MKKKIKVLLFKERVKAKYENKFEMSQKIKLMKKKWSYFWSNETNDNGGFCRPYL